ncbi:MAG: hypothetical protein MUE54_10730 [Anaerolineae bacterium]|nr:hypothetical protein [Anaerolineae bacterium]
MSIQLSHRQLPPMIVKFLLLAIKQTLPIEEESSELIFDKLYLAIDIAEKLNPTQSVYQTIRDYLDGFETVYALFVDLKCHPVVVDGFIIDIVWAE